MAEAPAKRPQSRGEEIANSVTHGAGLLASLAAAPFRASSALPRGSGAAVAGAAVFAGSVILLYLFSTLYHALPCPRAKSVFRALDHAAIFLLIAGTYTPFTLGVLRGAWGWTLLGLVWCTAVAGITLTAAGGVRHPKLSMALYLAMGWVAVAAVKPLWLRMPWGGLVLLAAGGIAYTAGTAFYAAKRLRYAHFVWHLFVIAGTSCHFAAVLRYAG